MKNNNLFIPERPKIFYQYFKDNYEIGQCDACPPGIMSVSLCNIDNPALEQLELQHFDFVTLHNEFKAIYSPDVYSNPVVLNQSAFNMLQFFKTPASLNHVYKNGFANEFPSDTVLKKLIELNILHPLNCVKPGLTEKNGSLTASLHLMDSCNLSCDYCYLPNQKLRLTLETGLNIIDKVIHSAKVNKYHKIKIKYTGGEPLSDFNLISELQSYAKKIATRNHIELSGAILSNGTMLKPKIIKQIKEQNLRLMISLDGIMEYNDCHRHFPDGSGSFEKISQAIDMALTQSLVPDISVTVSNRNVKGLPELIKWILDKDLPFSINFYRENNQSQKYADLRLEEENIIQGMLAAYKIIESKLPNRSLLACLADRTNMAVPHLRPCSAGNSYMVFDCKGNISKCQMDTPITDINDYEPLRTIKKGKAGLQNISVDEKEECNSCKWRYWCGGGCPLETFRYTGRYDKKSPNCNIYKALFPEIIRLEGLRLLKYVKPLEI